LSFLAAAVASGSSSSALSDVEPGALGFLIVAGIGLALVFLLRNMNKQFKKLGPPPEEEAGAPEEAGEPRDTVRTGDAKSDEKAEGAAKRG
jgi:hypothetical protein